MHLQGIRSGFVLGVNNHNTGECGPGQDPCLMKKLIGIGTGAVGTSARLSCLLLQFAHRRPQLILVLQQYGLQVTKVMLGGALRN